MRRNSAFTLVELIATIAIMAVLSVMAITFIGNYVTRAKARSDEQTLLVLNDALNRYKCEGGSLVGITEGTPMDRIMDKLHSDIVWNGFTHRVMNNAITVPATSLSAKGNGKAYRFTAYNTYTGETGGTKGVSSANIPVTPPPARVFIYIDYYQADQYGWLVYRLDYNSSTGQMTITGVDGGGYLIDGSGAEGITNFFAPPAINGGGYGVSATVSLPYSTTVSCNIWGRGDHCSTPVTITSTNYATLPVSFTAGTGATNSTITHSPYGTYTFSWNEPTGFSRQCFRILTSGSTFAVQLLSGYGYAVDGTDGCGSSIYVTDGTSSGTLSGSQPTSPYYPNGTTVQLSATSATVARLNGLHGTTNFTYP